MNSFDRNVIWRVFHPVSIAQPLFYLWLAIIFYCERYVVHPQARHKFHVPPKSTLEALAAASSGDIRGAINALQFACLKGRLVW